MTQQPKSNEEVEKIILPSNVLEYLSEYSPPAFDKEPKIIEINHATYACKLAYAASKRVGNVWVKASERLPVKGKPVPLKFWGLYGSGRSVGYYIVDDHNGTLKNEEVEWLDQSTCECQQVGEENRRLREFVIKYGNHLQNCNINQDWTEAYQAMANVPQQFRDEGYYIASEEMNNKRSQCTCGLTAALSSVSDAGNKEETEK